jgi:hypothetical protein
MQLNDNVDHPNHYNKGIEAIDVIESWNLNFNVGNVIKYMLRAPFKGEQIQDLEKAKWYLDRHIENVRKRQQ